MPLRTLRRLLLRHRNALLVVIFLSALEILYHISTFSVTRPSRPLDPPFSTKCVPPGASNPLQPTQPPPDALESRENAILLMLARNSDLSGAVTAIRSLTKRWNTHFSYPILFLNNEPFSSDFISALTAAASPATVSFETIPTSMWSYPTDTETGTSLIDQTAARRSMSRAAAKGLPYAGLESYHHMCRFYSQPFAHHPSLKPYKYYWRVEPDVTYTCRIPYDPFRQMRLARKKYGYTLALWEVGSTSPSLFRAVADYKASRSIPTTPFWTSFLSPSYAPWLLRNYLFSVPALFHSRTRSGDPWNFCHFWSNFEIADLDFFRSQEYTEFFEYLDRRGGFYMERWGDAPVHSLAAGLFLKAEETHWFGDLGYSHPPFQNCPAGADASTTTTTTTKGKKNEASEGIGCDCACDPAEGTVPDTCIKALRRAVDP